MRQIARKEGPALFKQRHLPSDNASQESRYEKDIITTLPNKPNMHCYRAADSLLVVGPMAACRTERTVIAVERANKHYEITLAVHKCNPWDTPDILS